MSDIEKISATTEVIRTALQHSDARLNLRHNGLGSLTHDGAIITFLAVGLTVMATIFSIPFFNTPASLTYMPTFSILLVFWSFPATAWIGLVFLSRHILRLSRSTMQDPSILLGVSVLNAMERVNTHIKEWNRYNKRLELGMVERDAGHDEYEATLRKCRDAINLSMQRTTMYLQDVKNDRPSLVSFPDLSESLTQLQEAQSVVQAHLNAAVELEGYSPLVLAKMQRDLDAALDEIPGHAGLRTKLAGTNS